MFELLQVEMPLVGEVALPHLLLMAGLLLMLLESMSPGAYLIVIGVALAGAGLVGLLLPIEASIFILSALTLVIGFGAAWVYREFDFYGGKGTAQTSDSQTLSGTTGYVTETVTPRGGEVKLNSGGFAPFYSARTSSGTIEEGEDVIVLDPGGGNVLLVENMSDIESDGIDRELAREANRESADEGGDSVGDAGSDGTDSTADRADEVTDETADTETAAEPETETES